MSPALTFGERLATARKRLGLTQSQFAARHGISKGTQVSYEHDRTYPSEEYLGRVAASGVDLEWLVGPPMDGLEPVSERPRTATVEEGSAGYETEGSFETQLKRLERATAAVRKVCNKYQDSDLNVDASFFVQVVYRYELSDAAAEDIMKLIRRSIPVRRPDN